jgi:predicted PurR-regulated permease PerM
MAGLRRSRPTPSPVVPKLLQRPPTDSAGWPRQEPPWLRRGVLLVLASVTGYLVALWLFGHLRGLLGLVFLAWLFAVGIEPLVVALTRRGLRRGLATGAVMLSLVLVLVGFLAVFGALLVDQLSQLVTVLPDAIADVVRWVNRTFDTTFEASDVVAALNLTPERVQGLAQDLAPGLVGILTSLVGLVFQGLTFLLFAYYISAEGPALRATVATWFPPRHQPVLTTVWEIAVDKTGGYLLSRLVLALLSAAASGVLMWAIGVPFWLPLAIWTGVVSQFIPTVGTYLAIALPALIALSAQPIDAVWIVVFGTVYQQVENYLIGPRITARTVDVHPAVAVGAVIAGAALFGPMGALVSIPVVAAVQAVIETYGHGYELAEVEPAAPPDGRAADDGAPAAPPGGQVRDDG